MSSPSPAPAPASDASNNRLPATSDASNNRLPATSDASNNRLPATRDASDNKHDKNQKGIMDDLKDNTDDFFGALLDKSNIVLLLWFLAIYFVLYFIVDMFRAPSQQGNQASTISRTFDFVILSLTVLLLIITYYAKTEKEKEKMVEDMMYAYTEHVEQMSTIVIYLVFIALFYLMIYLVGIPMEYDTRPATVYLIELYVWKTIVIAMIFIFFKKVLNISLKEKFDGWFKDIWEPDWRKKQAKEDAAARAKLKPASPSKPKEEVFNVKNNLYTYEDAQTICSAYGARLANYDEIEQAYQGGAEWCNYGWSEGQMIFFPTQKATWDKLQKSKTGKNSCGRPGINGGYIDNPYARFGVNCYGIKPKPSADEKKRMEEQAANPDAVIPKTEEDRLLEMKVKYWKENGEKILKLSGFNDNKWSAY